MSKAAKGKRNESKLADALEEYGWTAERVPRSVADATPLGDVVAVPPGVETADHEHRPITRAFSQGKLPLSAIDRIECKLTNSSAYGVKTLLKMHLRGTGLGTPCPTQWACGHLSGGPQAWVWWQQSGGEAVDPYHVEKELPKTAADLLDDEHDLVDAAAVRETGGPFVVVWR